MRGSPVVCDTCMDGIILIPLIVLISLFVIAGLASYLGNDTIHDSGRTSMRNVQALMDDIEASRAEPHEEPTANAARPGEP